MLFSSSLIKFSPSFRQSSGVSPYSFRVRDISITPIILPCIIISAILSGLLSNAVFICIPDQTPNCASGPFSLGNLFSFASRFTASPDKSVYPCARSEAPTKGSGPQPFRLSLKWIRSTSRHFRIPYLKILRFCFFPSSVSSFLFCRKNGFFYYYPKATGLYTVYILRFLNYNMY